MEPKKLPFVTGKTSIVCFECGHKFSRTISISTFEIKCPKCGSYDTEIA